MKLDHVNPTKFIKPVQIKGINDAIAISDYVILKSNETLHTLISQYDQLAYDSVTGVTSFCNVYQRRCVIIREDSTVWAWGKNKFGQLGNGSFEDSQIPVRVKDLNGIIAVSANYDYNLALKYDGTVWFWGLEKPSRSASVGRSIPMKIENLESVVQIYANHDCLVAKKDGSCWTFNVEDKIPIRVSIHGGQ